MKTRSGSVFAPPKDKVQYYCHQGRHHHLVHKETLDGGVICSICPAFYCASHLRDIYKTTQADCPPNWKCPRCCGSCTCSQCRPPHTLSEEASTSTSTSFGDTMPTGENNDIDKLNLEGICIISSDDDEDSGLDEDTCIQSREMFGKWSGVDENGDWKIVWPPMVIVRNTQFEQDENGKWIGMGPEKLLEYHKSSGAVQARHAFGPEGHKGISVLIFDTSAEGYAKAQLLSKKYECQSIGRANWDHNPSLFHHSDSRQLYGYLATVEDLEDFNQDLPGKWKLTFELASYEEKVVSQCEQWNKDSQQRKGRELNDAREERDRLLKLGEEEMRAVGTRKEDDVTKKVKLDGYSCRLAMRFTGAGENSGPIDLLGEQADRGSSTRER
ncbi:protein suppressor of gene silencing 3 [Tanacetum coccineum]